MEADLSEEIRAHLELAAEASVAAGLSPDEARFAAQRELGGVAQIEEACRDERSFVWIEHFQRDLRAGFRAVRRSPGFSAVAILTLAVAIGVNSAIFSLVHGLLLRSPVPAKPEEVVCVYSARQDAAREFRQFSLAEFTALRGSHEVFADVAAVNFNYAAVGRGEGLHRSFAFMVSENYFSLMGAQPAAGRFFAADECRPNARQRVVVASHELWRQHGGLPDFVGSILLVNGQPHTVVGVAPPGFSGINALIAPDLWLPFGLFADVAPAFGPAPVSPDLASPGNYTLNLVGRLQPGLTLAAARTRLPVLAERLTALQPPDSASRRELVLARPFSVGPTPQDDGPIRLVGALLLGMAGLVLVIACLNLANMLLARGAARAGEIAVRLALGATRGQIIRQLLTEGLVLALLGGALGILFCFWANALLQNLGTDLLRSMSFSLVLRLQPDVTVVAVTFVGCLLATLLFSLGPALQATRADLVHDLKNPGGAVAGRWNRFFAGRHLLIMVQMTLSLVLIFAAGLFIRAAMHAGGPDAGFKTGGVLLAEIDFSLAHTSPIEATRRMLAAVDRIRGLPGVQAAGLSTLVPYTNEVTTTRVVPAGTAPLPGKETGATPRGFGAIYAAITPGYLGSISATILRGRDFTENEARDSGAPPVCIIDEGLAAKLFPGQDALGRHVREARGGQAGEWEVVGLVARHNQDVLDKGRAAPRFYVPFGRADHAAVFLTASCPGQDSAALLNSASLFRGELRQLDPDLPVLQLVPYTTYVGKSYNLWMGRLGAVMFGVFGGIALLLAMLGIYGVKAYAVERRTREIGIRVALGADRREVFFLIIKQGAQQTACAVVFGIALSLPAGRALASLLVGVSATDPLVLGLAAGVLGFATLLACIFPARRATRISPLTALRSE
jgi:predicted permease